MLDQIDDRPPEEPDAPPQEPDGPPAEPEEAGPLDDVGRENVVPFRSSALANMGSAFEPPEAELAQLRPPTEPEPGPQEAPPLALVLRREDLLATVRAMKVVDAASYTRACDFALTINDWLKEAEGYWDPRVALSHARWKQDCDDRSAFTADLKVAKSTLTTAADGWKRAADAQAARVTAERQAKLDRDAAAERTRLQQQAQQARQAGDSEQAADLFQAARRVEAQVVRQEPVAPAVRGVSHRERWVAEVIDQIKLIQGVSGTDKIREAIQFRIEAFEATPTVEGAAVVVRELRDLQVFINQLTPGLSPDAVSPNLTYLGARARADKDTIAEEWRKYGIRVYDAGSTAISSRGRR